MSFVLTSNALNLLGQTSNHKVALMCADSTFAYNPNRPMLMEFPNPVEVLVNSRKLHANLKGMKNKPGTVPPADITSFLDRTPRLSNRLDITYSCGTDTSKKFGAQVALLKTFSVEELVERIRTGNRFTKESVLEKLRKPDDDDIEMASFDLTLKDPLSYMRITVPCRSTFCKHNQCWDAMAFLSINEQTPQWTCPICHAAINGLQAIAVDGYFQDILDSVDPDVDTILVDPNGEWKIPGETKESDQVKKDTRPNSEAPLEVLDLGDTEDEDESKNKTTPAFDNQQVPRAETPNIVAANGPAAKRKAPPVCIDLTEDSDEEVEPPKRIKHSGSMEAQSGIPLAAQRRFPEGVSAVNTPIRANNDQHSSSMLPSWEQSPLRSVQAPVTNNNGHHFESSSHNNFPNTDVHSSTNGGASLQPNQSTSGRAPSHELPSEYSSPLPDLSWDTLLPLPEEFRTASSLANNRADNEVRSEPLLNSPQGNSGQDATTDEAPRPFSCTTNGREEDERAATDLQTPNRNDDESPPILAPGSRSSAPSQAFVYEEEFDKEMNENVPGSAEMDSPPIVPPGSRTSAPVQPFVFEDDQEFEHNDPDPARADDALHEYSDKDFSEYDDGEALGQLFH